MSTSELGTTVAAAPSTRDGQALCGECGLCCNGTWFDEVPLDPDEVESARGAGLDPQVSSDGTFCVRQPCVLHQDNRCTAYSHRPMACASYRCMLLKRYLDGEIPLQTAVSRAQAARTMAIQVRAEAGDFHGSFRNTQFTAHVAREDDRSPSGANDALAPATRLGVVALLVYYDKHFKLPQVSRGSTVPTDDLVGGTSTN